MSRKKNKIFSLVKWLVLLAAYGFLIYKLAHIEYWNELKNSFSSLSFIRILFLVSVLILMPVNWMLEARKWQFLTQNILNISFKNSIKAVLAGLNTGYITPNRIGEFAGRIIFLPTNHRVAGIVLSLVNSLTQNIIITVFGIAGAIVYFSKYSSENNFNTYLIVLGVGIIIAIAVYFTFPAMSRKLKSGNISEKIKQILYVFSNFKAEQLFKILGVSTIRYFVFCLQFFLMLQFFNIEITGFQAFIAIPTMYLLITFTPSFAASEPAIRSSIAALVIGAFSTNEIGIILTGILIWLINFVVPMLAGSVVVGSTKEQIE